MADRPLDLGEPGDVNKKKQEAERNEQRRIDTLAYFLANENGRKYFYNLLASCGVGRSPFAPNALNMAHNTGAQRIGLEILGDLTRPELINTYVQMMKENFNAPVHSRDTVTQGPGGGVRRGPSPGGDTPG